MLGAVKFWNEERGFGFVHPDDGSLDVWFGRSVRNKSGAAALKDGDRVEFEIERVADGRMRASELRKLR